ncbi:LysR family transcriptional regulator [Marinibaculum pumilum]|uniref:LysR family transcriptional regulator n=1 Tax=Marinibaculum pumilum TaxID=1766165 RepID=A0ABV7L695_9PROT
MRDIDTSLLRAFIAIVDAGSFNRAARRLSRTQSALSMQIKRLEELVGATLFDRTMRPLQLTAAGEGLVAAAREMLAINDAALEAIRSERIAGQVRLAIMEDYAAGPLAPLLGRFLADHPAVQVELHTGLTADMVDDLGVRYDLVVAMLPAGAEGGELLYRGRSVWAAAPGFDPGTREVLPLALYPQGCLFRKWATRALDRAGRRWRIGVVSLSAGAVHAAVREGWCLSVFKDFTVPGDLAILPTGADLPALPDFEIRLFRAPSARTRAGLELARFLAATLHAAPVARVSAGSAGRAAADPAR